MRSLNPGITVTQLRIHGQYLGAFALLQRFEEGKNGQNTLHLQMIRQSHRAKYTFEDTIGESPAVPRATEIAKPMAGNNVSILLDGESGTEKTLCAGNQQRLPPAEQQLSP